MWCLIVFLFCFYFSDKPEGEGKSSAPQHLPTDLFEWLALSHSDLIMALTFSLLLTYLGTSPCQAEADSGLWGCYLHVPSLHSLTLFLYVTFILFIYPSMLLYMFYILPSGIFTENLLYYELADYWSCLLSCLQITVKQQTDGTVRGILWSLMWLWSCNTELDLKWYTLMQYIFSAAEASLIYVPHWGYYGIAFHLLYLTKTH